MKHISLVTECKMSAAYIDNAKGMASWLLHREHRGPGDTIDAAAHRLERRYGVPSALLMRLRHREVKDMLMSNFLALAQAYQSATERMERNLEHEKAMATNAHILRLALTVAGPTDQPQNE